MIESAGLVSWAFDLILFGRQGLSRVRDSGSDLREARRLTADVVRVLGRYSPQLSTAFLTEHLQEHFTFARWKPQVVVALAQQNSSLVSVLGDVRTAGRFPASPSGERILDVIARAGGPVSQGYDVWGSLERKGHRASVPFGALLYEPANDIYARPNDVIYLFNQPQTFLAFGAAGSNNGFCEAVVQASLLRNGFRKREPPSVKSVKALTASCASGGCVDGNCGGGRNGFFYTRGETREVAGQLGIDCSKYVGPIIPVIYNLDLRDPSGYFLAQKFDA